MKGITEKVVYVTKDGKQFDSVPEAVRHQEVIDLAANMQEASNLYWSSTNTTPMGVAKWILENYDISRRQKPEVK